MSYVSIWKPVNDRIIQASRETRNEIIGLLLGRLEDDTIIIEDSITGNFSSEPNRVMLPPATLAKIADQIVSGRIKGNIVGWYHSHTEAGVFFSETDTRTQLNLQQFSEFIVGIVIDAQTGETGFFRVDPRTRKPSRISEDRIQVFMEHGEAIVPEARQRALVRATPTIEVRTRQPQAKSRRDLKIFATIAVILVVSFSILGAVILLQPTAQSTNEINVIPVANTPVGTPVRITANVTGTIRNVTLHYAQGGSSEFADVQMTQANAEQYTYVVSGDQVTGSLTYYVTGQDVSGRLIQTRTFIIQVADFSLVPMNQLAVIYRTRSSVTQFNIVSTSGFNSPVTLSATTPPGVRAAFSNSPAQPGTTQLLNLTASELAANGTFPVTITATYSPVGAGPVTRQATIMITVTDFDITISPTSSQVTHGSSVSYTIDLTIQQGFTDKVSVTVSGAPTGVTTLLSGPGNIVPVGPGTYTLTLQVTAAATARPGIYNIVVTATGDGVTHAQTLQLIVR